jgi:hypothetical protein
VRHVVVQRGQAAAHAAQRRRGGVIASVRAQQKWDE